MSDDSMVIQRIGEWQAAAAHRGWPSGRSRAGTARVRGRPKQTPRPMPISPARSGGSIVRRSPLCHLGPECAALSSHAVGHADGGQVGQAGSAAA